MPAFVPKDWEDSPATTTPITAAELERIEAGIVNAVTLDTVQTITGAKTMGTVTVTAPAAGNSASLYVRNDFLTGGGSKAYEFFTNIAGAFGAWDVTRSRTAFQFSSDSLDNALVANSTGITVAGQLREGANRVWSAGNVPPTMLTTDGVGQVITGGKYMQSFFQMEDAAFTLLSRTAASAAMVLRKENIGGTPGNNKAVELSLNDGGDTTIFDQTRGTAVMVATTNARANALTMHATGATSSGALTGEQGVYDGSNRVYSVSNPPPVSSVVGSHTSLFTTADQSISTVTAATNTDVTSLSFNMAANTTYEVYGTIYFTVAATTTGFRWGLAGPTGTASVSAEYSTSTSAEAVWVQNNTNAAIAPTMTVTTASAFAAPLPVQVSFRGLVTCGATAGALRVQMASELASTALTVKRGSSFFYRAV
jgi:hypothetical protein